MKKQFLTLIAYLGVQKITQEAFDAMPAEEQAKIFNDLNENNVAAINEMEANNVSKEDLQKAINDLNESKLEQMKTLNKALEEMGLAIKAVTEKDRVANPKLSIRDSLVKLKEDGTLAKIKDGEINGMKTVTKAVGTMLESTNITGGNVPVEQRIAGLNLIASRQVRFLDVLTKATASSNIISWVYQSGREGAAGGTLEGAAKNQIDFNLVVGEQSVVKRTAFVKVSTEMIDDIDFIQSEINNELLNELLRDVEQTAYNGNGTAPNLNGVLTVASAFAAGAAAASVDNANNVDVINNCIKQIKLANQTIDRGIIFMNPEDVYSLKTLKVSSTDKRYVDMVYMAGDEMRISGIPIIETTLVTAGTYLIGDFSKAILYNKDEISVMLGLDGNDLTLNLRTIIAEWRGALVVRNNNRTAFVTGTFATDAAALETV